MLSNLDIHQRIFYLFIIWNHMTELGINFQASYIPKMGSSHNVVQKKDFFFLLCSWTWNDFPSYIRTQDGIKS